jgi:hypothetical protein
MSYGPISRTCSAAPPIVNKILRKTNPADIPDKAAAEFLPYNRKGTRRNRAADITCTRQRGEPGACSLRSFLRLVQSVTFCVAALESGTCRNLRLSKSLTGSL